MRSAPHRHPCAICGVKVECPGEYEQNVDGEPEVICREFMDWNRREFLCQDCGEQQAMRTVNDMLENV